jgi:hypothetical protein
MDASLVTALRSLLDSRQVAALATLHRGEPALSMVPWAWLPSVGFVIHVSRLATHTADMLAHPAVALLVSAAEGSAATPQELPRASFQAHAEVLDAGTEPHAQARERYLARFPHSEPMFGFADFSLVAIVPRSVRFVAGFARAVTIGADEFHELMSDAD